MERAGAKSVGRETARLRIQAPGGGGGARSGAGAGAGAGASSLATSMAGGADAGAGAPHAGSAGDGAVAADAAGPPRVRRAAAPEAPLELLMATMGPEVASMLVPRDAVALGRTSSALDAALAAAEALRSGSCGGVYSACPNAALPENQCGRGEKYEYNHAEKKMHPPTMRFCAACMSQCGKIHCFGRCSPPGTYECKAIYCPLCWPQASKAHDYGYHTWDW